MITDEQFTKVLKFINNIHSKLDIVSEGLNENQKSWINAAQDDLKQLTDYVVDEIKIKE